MRTRKKILDIELIFIPGDDEGDHIFLFHGYGANEFDLASLSEYIFPRDKPTPNYYFPAGTIPIDYDMGYPGKAWFPMDVGALQKAEPRDYADMYPPEFERSRKMITEAISWLGLEPSKIILGGFSQGAMLAVDIALNHEESVKGLLIYSGALVNQKKWQELIPRHQDLSFFQSHGTQDPLLRIEAAEELNKTLLHGGMKGEFFSFSGGHEISQETLNKTVEFLSQLDQG